MRLAVVGSLLVVVLAACGGTGTKTGTCQPDCQDRTCGDDGCGGSCGTCQAWQMCPGTACILDPASTWDLIADHGSVSSMMWDGVGGAPDPFVCASMDGMQTCTDPVMNSNIPQWHKTMFTKVRADALKTGFFVQYLDNDGSMNDVICYGDVPVHTQDFSNGYFDAVCNDNPSDVVFDLVYDP